MAKEEDPIEKLFWTIFGPILGAGFVVGIIFSAIIIGIVWLIV